LGQNVSPIQLHIQNTNFDLIPYSVPFGYDLHHRAYKCLNLLMSWIYICWHTVFLEYVFLYSDIISMHKTRLLHIFPSGVLCSLVYLFHCPIRLVLTPSLSKHYQLHLGMDIPSVCSDLTVVAQPTLLKSPLVPTLFTSRANVLTLFVSRAIGPASFPSLDPQLQPLAT